MLNKDYYILLSISEVVEKIITFSISYKNSEEFHSNARDFDATMMNFVVVGELVGKLSDEFKNKNSNIDWFKINALRNIISSPIFWN